MQAMISLPLDIPDVKVLSTTIDGEGDIIITVESTLESTKCRKCGRTITKSHGHDDWITLRHLSILGRRVYIRLRPKRFRCLHCSRKPTTTQRLEWYEPKCSTTKAYEEHVLLQLVNSTVQDVSLKEDIGYDTVEGIIERRINQRVDWDEWDELNVVGLDEIALKKGHRDYVTIVTTRQADGRVGVLAVLPDREKKTVKQFLQTIPDRLKRTIHTVCTDMWEGFVNAAKEVLGKDVTIVVDRYHVAKKYRECADKLRRREGKRLKKELSEEEYKRLKGVMWAFRKKKADLKLNEKERLDRLFAYSPDLKRAYDLREELTAIFEEPLTKEEAEVKIKAWEEKVKESGLTCFNSFLTTLDNWRDEIINYFPQRHTSGFVEGLNNKVKVLKRRCYGILDASHLFQRIYLDLEGYRLFGRACA